MKSQLPLLSRKSAAVRVKPDVVREEYGQAHVSQRHGFMFAVFVIWMLSIPFYQFSLIGTYSLDNLLAPILLMGAFVLPSQRDSRARLLRTRAIAIVMGFYAVYVVAGLVPVIDSSEQFWGRVWLAIRDMFYLIVPILYVRDKWSWGVAKVLVIYNACVGGLTAFLASIGLIHLEIVRFEASRVGIDWLPKAIGLFGSYGDMAMLCGFTVAVLASHKKGDLCCGMASPIGKALVWVAVLLGLAGSQSRNMFVAMVTSLLTYWFMRRYVMADINGRRAMQGLAASVGIVSVGFLFIFGGWLSDAISQWGGVNAYTTAHVRMLSYKQALDLILQDPIFGVSGQLYEQWQGLIESIHNMWLRILLQRGAIGFFAVLGIFVFALRSVLQAIKVRGFEREGAVVLGSLVALFVAVEFYPGLSDVVRIILALVIASRWVAATGSVKYG